MDEHFEEATKNRREIFTCRVGNSLLSGDNLRRIDKSDGREETEVDESEHGYVELRERSEDVKIDIWRRKIRFSITAR